jgi:hypothetical protein
MTVLDDPGVVALYGTHWRRLTTIPASAPTRMCLSNKAPWFTVADDLPNIWRASRPEPLLTIPDRPIARDRSSRCRAERLLVVQERDPR